jgi:hypothetical protein
MIKLLMVFLVSLSAVAKADGWFGAAGNDRCGLGTMIFGKSANSISSQTSEESTNGFMSNETFSVVTGTSGCSNSGIVQVPQEELFYANLNYEELTVEMASGNGKVLAGLAQIMGCDSGDMDLFVQTTKSNYGSVYASPKTTPYEMLVHLRSKLQQKTKLVSSCRSLQS